MRLLVTQKFQCIILLSILLIFLLISLKFRLKPKIIIPMYLLTASGELAMQFQSPWPCTLKKNKSLITLNGFLLCMALLFWQQLQVLQILTDCGLMTF